MKEDVNGAQLQLFFFCWEQIISLPLEGSVLSAHGLFCLSVNKLKCNHDYVNDSLDRCVVGSGMK